MHLVKMGEPGMFSTGKCTRSEKVLALIDPLNTSDLAAFINISQQVEKAASAVTSGIGTMQEQIVFLHAENLKLRKKNELLKKQIAELTKGKAGDPAANVSAPSPMRPETGPKVHLSRLAIDEAPLHYSTRAEQMVAEYRSFPWNKQEEIKESCRDIFKLLRWGASTDVNLSDWFFEACKTKVAKHFSDASERVVFGKSEFHIEMGASKEIHFLRKSREDDGASSNSVHRSPRMILLRFGKGSKQSYTSDYFMDLFAFVMLCMEMGLMNQNGRPVSVDSSMTAD